MTWLGTVGGGVQDGGVERPVASIPSSTWTPSACGGAGGNGKIGTIGTMGTFTPEDTVAAKA